MFYLTTHSTHFIYGYMASDIWLRTIMIVRKETRCRHIGYSYRLTARVLLYAPSNRQDNTYHSLCYTSCGALAGTRNSSMGPTHEGSIRRPTARTMSERSTSELCPAPIHTQVFLCVCLLLCCFFVCLCLGGFFLYLCGGFHVLLGLVLFWGFLCLFFGGVFVWSFCLFLSFSFFISPHKSRKGFPR